MTDQIFLIGYRAAGKSTIGKMLAESLSIEFIDTDQFICKKYRTSIADLVAAQGWDTFRKYEADALREVADACNMVVATGGGAVLHKNFWNSLNKHKLVVWLKADLSVLGERLQKDEQLNGDRPSLTGASVHDEVERVYLEREPLYQEFADLIVNTGEMNISEAVDRIVEEFRRRRSGSIK